MELDNNKAVSIKLLSEENIKALQALFPDLGNESISSIALFTTDNKTYLYQSNVTEQSATSLTLTQNRSESIIYYTTYDDTKYPVRCCINKATYDNGVLKSLEQKYGDADSIIESEGKFYYLSYNANESGSKRCCAHNSIQAIDNNDQLVWKPMDPVLFCRN